MNENKPCIESKSRTEITNIQAPILVGKLNSRGRSCKQTKWF